jgi:hypothetical protein
MPHTPAQIVAADRILNPGWYDDDACHCIECSAGHERELAQTSAALLAAESALSVENAQLREALGAILRDVAPFHPSWPIWDQTLALIGKLPPPPPAKGET